MKYVIAHEEILPSCVYFVFSKARFLLQYYRGPNSTIGASSFYIVAKKAMKFCH